MSALDRLHATRTPTASTKKSSKIAAVLSQDLKVAVDEVIVLKAQIKAAEATLGDREGALIEAVRPQQDDKAFNGLFSKSFLLEGVANAEGNAASLSYVTADKFSVPQEPEQLEAIKGCVGAQKYAEFFVEEPTVLIRAEVINNDSIMTSLLNAAEAAGLDINSIFDQRIKVKAKEGLDEKQYTLTPAKLAQFRTLVRQNKPSLR